MQELNKKNENSARDLLLIKIDGRAFTNEDNEYSLRQETIKIIAGHLPENTILMHGSTPYGKPPTIRQGLLNGAGGLNFSAD